MMYYLPKDIVDIIADYVEEKKLKNDVDEKKLVDGGLCDNIHAFDYFRKICGEERKKLKKLSANESSAAAPFLLQYLLEDIDWYCFSQNSNPSAVEYLIQHPGNINYEAMSGNTNPKAIEFLLQHHSDKICLETLYGNPCDLAVEHVLKLVKKEKPPICWLWHNSHPKIIDYCINNFGKDCLRHFSSLPNDKVVDYILKNQAVIDEYFSENPHPRAVDYLLKNQNLISKYFSANENPRAVDYLLKKPELIHWELFSGNPLIFETDPRIAEKLRLVFG